MQVVRYLLNFFHCPAGSSEVKYAVGTFHPSTDETLHHVAAGYAELVDAPEDAAEAAAKADAATRLATRAVDAAVKANVKADAAAAVSQSSKPAGKKAGKSR